MTDPIRERLDDLETLVLRLSERVAALEERLELQARINVQTARRRLAEDTPA